MANWKRILTEADLAGGSIISSVVGGQGLTATTSAGGVATVNAVAGNGITVNANDITLDLDGNSLELGSSGLKIADDGVTNVHLDTTAITGFQAAEAAVVDADLFLFHDQSTSKLKKLTASQLASYIATTNSGDYDLDLVNNTTGEVSELQLLLDGTVEKRVRFVNQDNETTITTGGGGSAPNDFESVTIGLADDVEIDDTLKVMNSGGITGTVFQVVGPGSSVFEGNVVVNGNLTVAGNTTTTVVDTLEVEDSTFLINSDAGGAFIANGGMVLNTSSGTTAKLEWRGSNNLSGWAVTNNDSNTGNSAATTGFEVAVMDFKAGAPDNATNPVFGAGSFLYDTTNDAVYINLA